MADATFAAGFMSVLRERPLLGLRHFQAETFGMASASDGAVTCRPTFRAAWQGRGIVTMTTMRAKNRTAKLVDKRLHKTANTMMDKTARRSISMLRLTASSRAKTGTR